MAKKQLLSTCIIFLLACSGCSSTFEGIGKDFGTGLVEPVKANADSITSQAVKGATTELTKPELESKLDSLITLLGQTTNKQLKDMRDTLIGTVTQQRLESIREELIGEKTKGDLLAIRNSLFDRYLQEYIQETVKQIGPNLLGESTKIKVAELRDTVLGSTSNMLVKAIIDTAMNDLQSRLKNEVYPEMRANLSFVEKNATWLIVLIGFVAIIVTWFIWKQKEKYLQLTKVLTYHISELGDVGQKEVLKSNISKNAKMIGIEDDLRELLDKQGLLHMKQS